MNLFKRKNKNSFDYQKFLCQISLSEKRKHLLTDKEVNEYFLNKIDRNKYHVGFTYCISVGEFIDSYNWEVYVYEKLKDENGNLSKEYYSPSNVAIVNSKYMNEYTLYKTLYELRRKDETD